MKIFEELNVLEHSPPTEIAPLNKTIKEIKVKDIKVNKIGGETKDENKAKEIKSLNYKSKPPDFTIETKMKKYVK